MGLEALDGRAARQLVTLLTERDFRALTASDATLRGLFDCDADFAPATNGPTACSYHPAGLFELVDSGAMDIFYVCCGARYNPIYRHFGRSESGTEDEALQNLRAVPGCVTSAHEVCRPITDEIPDGPIQAYFGQHGEWIDATAHEDGPHTIIVTPLGGSDSAMCRKHIPYRFGAGPTPYPLLLRHPPVAD